MSEIVVEVIHNGERREHEVRGPMARIGGSGSEVPVPGAQGELQVWTSPPKLVHMEGPTPTVAGQELPELPLVDASVVDWAGARLLFRVSEPVAVELPPPPAPEPVAAPAVSEAWARGWKRLAAGMVVELKLADRKAASRAQQDVLENNYDADTSAEDILTSSGIQLDDPRLVERAGRLQRDLLMISFQTGVRGAGRKARKAARGGAAFLISQVVAIGVYTLILLAIVLLLRVNKGFSLDGTIDSWLDFISSGR